MRALRAVAGRALMVIDWVACVLTLLLVGQFIYHGFAGGDPLVSGWWWLYLAAQAWVAYRWWNGKLLGDTGRGRPNKY